MSANLETKTKWVSVIVSVQNKDFGECSRSLKSYLDAEAHEYAYILHNMDLNDEGEYKTPHYHVVSEFKTARRLKSFLKDIATALGVSDLAVTISKCVSMAGSIQYLVHKHDQDKYQYPISAIVTNLSEEDLNLYMNAETETGLFEKIDNAVCRSMSRRDIIRTLGLKVYTQYYKVINDLVDFYHSRH